MKMKVLLYSQSITENYIQMNFNFGYWFYFYYTELSQAGGTLS